MGKKVVIDFDCIGYRKHLFEAKKHCEDQRDKYGYKSVMWNTYDSISYCVQSLINDMDYYVTFEED